MLINIVFITVFILFFVTNKLLEKMFVKKEHNSGGNLPVDKQLFAIGKISVLLTWSAAVLQASGHNIRMIILPAGYDVLAASLFVAGFVLSTIAHLYLAEANTPVLPDGTTALKTRGIFRFSRNPSYLGIYLMIIASIIFTADIIVVALGITGIVIHHRIIKNEEEFLKTRFGAAFDAYCSKTRRYI